MSSTSESDIGIKDLIKSNGREQNGIYTSDSSCAGSVRDGRKSKRAVAVGKKRGPKSSVPLDLLHAQFDQRVHSIVKNSVLVTPSETVVYEEIAEHFQEYGTHAKAIYQAAKYYFIKRIKNLVTKVKIECEDYMSTYDKYHVGSERHASFNVKIEGIHLFRDENGISKPHTEWAPLFRKIVFAMSRNPCAWSVGRPRNVANEITFNCVCLERACPAKVYAYTENNQKSLIIKVTQHNTGMKHAKKIRFAAKSRI